MQPLQRRQQHCGVLLAQHLKARTQQLALLGRPALAQGAGLEHRHEREVGLRHGEAVAYQPHFRGLGRLFRCGRRSG
ncbi:MAG: hypothetical protein ACK559_02110, partial [bacterium]